MKKHFLYCGIFCILSVLLPGSCVSQAELDTIQRGAGAPLGTVSAAAVVCENRATGEITGDTLKYGHIDKVTAEHPADRKDSGNPDKAPAPVSVADKALANALYDIIQQIRKKGGDAVTDILTDIDRNYDPETKIETARVKVSAQAVKMTR